jgi:putative membrane protein
MKNHFGYYGAALALTLACLGCNNGSQDNSAKDAKDTNAVKMDSSANANQPVATIPPSVTKDDATFAVNAASGGMMEVQFGQLAQQKGMGQDVKDFGAMMEKDHTALGNRLKAIAASKNLTLPNTMTPDQQKEMDDLQKKTGKDFDKAYINMMVDDHKTDIKDFEKEAKDGSDADIRAFADSSLHTLKMHLSAAEKCKNMSKKM